MKFVGKIQNVLRDYARRVSIIQIESVDFRIEYNPEAIYDFKYEKHREGKTENQRKYYWKLVTMISQALKPRRSLAYVHNDMLRHYGYLADFDGEHIPVVICVDNSDKVDEDLYVHLRPTSELREGKDGRMYRTYLMLRGSSSYNVQEMNSLIDGAIDTAKQMDLKTDTPEEIARMKTFWGE